MDLVSRSVKLSEPRSKIGISFCNKIKKVPLNLDCKKVIKRDTEPSPLDLELIDYLKKGMDVAELIAKRKLRGPARQQFLDDVKSITFKLKYNKEKFN